MLYDIICSPDQPSAPLNSLLKLTTNYFIACCIITLMFYIMFLADATIPHYSLKRSHDRILRDKTGHLSECTFLIRMLLKRFINTCILGLSCRRCYSNHPVHVLLLRPGREAEYCDKFVCPFVCVFVCLSVCLCVCLFACLSVREHISRTAGLIFTKFGMQIPRGRGSVLLSSGSVATCHVLPVLWTTSRLAVVGRMALRS